MTSLCFGSGVPVASEEVVDDGGYDEREDDGDEEPSDDSDGQGLEHLGSCTQGEGQRQHPADCGDGGHDDGAETALGGVEHGFSGEVSVVVAIWIRGLFEFGLRPEFFVSVKEKDAVFGDDADDHDETHEAGYVEVGPGDEQSEHDASDGEDRAGEDCDGRGEVAELREEHTKDQS